MRILKIIIVFAFIANSLESAFTETREVYSLDSIERGLPYNFTDLHSETIAEFDRGVWDLNTGEQLAGPEGSLNYAIVSGLEPNSEIQLQMLNAIPERGILLDFDLSTGRVAYRTHSGSIEVRSGENNIIFESEHADPLLNREVHMIDRGQLLIVRTVQEQSTKPLLEMYSIASGERIWQRTGEGSTIWTIVGDTSTCLQLELKPIENENDRHIATLFNLINNSVLDTAQISRRSIPPQIAGVFGTTKIPILNKIEKPVFFISGISNSLLIDGQNQKLADFPIANTRSALYSSNRPWSSSVDSDSQYTRHILFGSVFPNVIGASTMFVFDSIEKAVIATSADLRLNIEPTHQGDYHAISPDGQLFFKAMRDGTIEVWNLEEKSFNRLISVEGVIFDTIIPSDDSSKVFASGTDSEQNTYSAMFEIESGQLIYEIEFEFPNVFEYETNALSKLGFNRSATISPSKTRVYFQSIIGIETFDFDSGELIETSSIFRGRIIASCFVQSQKSWVTVYETGKVLVENSIDSNATFIFQLPNDDQIQFATIDALSGSIAFKRKKIAYSNSYTIVNEASIVIIHSFDDRELQNIAVDSYEETQPLLAGGGKWLIAPLNGIFDLTNQEAYDISEQVYANDAFHYESKKWARETPNGNNITIENLEGETSQVLDTSSRFTNIAALEFSKNGNTLYCLASPINSSYQQQSIYVIDTVNGTILSETKLTGPPESGEYSTITRLEIEGTLVAASDSGTILIADTNEKTTGIPYTTSTKPFLDPYVFFEVTPFIGANQTRYVSSYGDILDLRSLSTHLIQSNLEVSANSKAILNFNSLLDRDYWIQSSNELSLWKTHLDTEFIYDWFESNEKGFFKVYESEPLE